MLSKLIALVLYFFVCLLSKNLWCRISLPNPQHAQGNTRRITSFCFLFPSRLRRRPPPSRCVWPPPASSGCSRVSPFNIHNPQKMPNTSKMGWRNHLAPGNKKRMPKSHLIQQSSHPFPLDPPPLFLNTNPNRQTEFGAFLFAVSSCVY